MVVLSGWVGSLEGSRGGRLWAGEALEVAAAEDAAQGPRGPGLATPLEGSLNGQEEELEQGPEQKGW